MSDDLERRVAELLDPRAFDLASDPFERRSQAKAIERARTIIAECFRWRPIAMAPKDGSPMLWLGRWKPFDILQGGGPAMIIVRWSTIMSNGTGYRWITEGLSAPENYNVEWTHYQPLPPLPEDQQ